MIRSARPRTALAATAAAGVLFLAGCGTSSGNAVPTTAIATYPGTAVVSDTTTLLEGELEVQDNCLRVVTGGDQNYVPVFPEGEIHSSSGSATVFGDTLEAGDDVEFRGGGEIPTDATIPASCADLPADAYILVTDGDA